MAARPVAVLVQFPLTPILRLPETYEVQNQEYVDMAIWVTDCSEHTTVLFVPAGGLIINFVTESSLVCNSYRYIYAIELQHKYLCGMNQEREQKTIWNSSSAAYDCAAIQVLTC